MVAMLSNYFMIFVKRFQNVKFIVSLHKKQRLIIVRMRIKKFIKPIHVAIVPSY